ncbi:thioredoxin family protein [Streptomyces scabiei]|uniref:thioredoxin family protein n=1 Tax=Streptomyces scabiei TaxID=1930 RepID=UPI0029A14068|nr:thioredoxin family protein [Streptomyces scabiei]MDX3520338.1 thioredoxin family protein [Streptomyces scabiei]
MNTNTHTPAHRPEPPHWRRLCRTAAVVLGVTLAAAPYASASPATSHPANQKATAGATQQAGTEAPAARAGGEVIKVTSAEQYDVLVHSMPRVIAMFAAVWCGPCKRITPDFEYLSTQHGTVTFLSIDVDANPDLAYANKVNAMPKFIAIRNARHVESLEGARGEELRRMVRELAAS